MFWKTTALVVTLAIASANASAQGKIVPPAVPGNLEVPPEFKPFVMAQGTGTQNYICLATNTGVEWKFQGPQATLFNDRREQVMTHFLSPNPLEFGALRATWQHSHDSSAVWALAIADSTDPAFVAEGAIPWLLLEVVFAELGPTSGDRMAGTRFIQRVNTSGGIAPASGCSGVADLGKRAMVPYVTDYVFYR